MFDCTLVSIFNVNEDGSTGKQVGTGVLLTSDVVLVQHPPLSDQLAESKDPVRLRVGAAATEGRAVDVIDVKAAAPHVGEVEGEPTVALELSRPAAIPIKTCLNESETQEDFNKHLVEHRKNVPAAPKPAEGVLSAVEIAKRIQNNPSRGGRAVLQQEPFYCQISNNLPGCG